MDKPTISWRVSWRTRVARTSTCSDFDIFSHMKGHAGAPRKKIREDRGLEKYCGVYNSRSIQVPKGFPGGFDAGMVHDAETRRVRQYLAVRVVRMPPPPAL